MWLTRDYLVDMGVYRVDMAIVFYALPCCNMQHQGLDMAGFKYTRTDMGHTGEHVPINGV